jgi:hypothetical protein
MATSMLEQDARTALESRAGVESLDVLHDKRRRLIDRIAPLKALHGHNGLWDDKRKQMLEACKVRARMELTAASQKATDAMVEAMAYGDEQYATFLDRGVEDRIEYLTLANALTELEERIQSRQTELLCYNAETRLR